MATRELLTLCIVACATFATRLFPFALFGRHQTPPPIVLYIGKYLPSAIIALLIIYCLKYTQWTDFRFLPELISILLVGILHVWKRNNLLSIGVGTLCYMFMVQVLFHI